MARATKGGIKMNLMKFTVAVFVLCVGFVSIANAADNRNHRRAQLPSSQPSKEPAAQTVDETVLDQSLLDEVQLAPATGAGSWRYAAGINLAWTVRRDYGARSFRRFEPEVVGYLYTPIPIRHGWLRHGARLSYSNDQPQMPKYVRMEESDWKLSIEEGLIWNWYVSPSMTFGYGYNWRKVSVRNGGPVKSADTRLNSRQTFTWQYLQLGVGLPALYGEYEFQPSVRFQKLSWDDRTTWGFGFEFTKAW